MQLTWLHVSDFHVHSGDPYDRDVVLRALVKSVEDFRRRGHAPDVIFATGDVAYSGKAEEYKLATKFFDDLIKAAGLQKRHLYVIPGNHDVDRNLGVGLARTLASREDADTYFNPALPKPHLVQKMGAFIKWHDGYFKGIRAIPRDSTCGPLELIEVRKHKIGILPINSALFCQDDNDHDKLLVGRRCLDTALEKLKALHAGLCIALVHHPLEWLSSLDRANIKSKLHANVDFILRGHLHETEVESVAAASGQLLYCAAGAAYQTRKWPNRATYAAIDGSQVTIFPIRYEDQPQEVWTVDPSIFPYETNYEKTIPIPRLTGPTAAPQVASPKAPSEPAPPRFRSNVAFRNLPLVGREDDLSQILDRLGSPSRECVLVLHGQPGVGKSELAREFARRNRDRYPGGTFALPVSGGAPIVDLARIGSNLLDLNFPSDLSLQDQAQRAFIALADTPTLLIYDDLRSVEAILRWLPPAGMACHVLITTLLEKWDSGWLSFEVKPLSHTDSVKLVEELGGREVARRFGDELATLAGGLPVQICPQAATLAYEQRRGRLEEARLTLTREASQSFRGVYERLERPARLLLHSGAFLNHQRLPREELSRQLEEALSWKKEEIQRAFDACLDLHLLEGAAELRMHQLFARFLLETAPAADDAAALRQVRAVQARRLVELAEQLSANPARAELAASLLAFPVIPVVWQNTGTEISIAGGETVGRALYEIGHFEEARPWFERAVEAAQKGDVQGRVDHGELGKSLHTVGYCLSSVGKYEEARPWYERAVEAKRKGDVHGRVNHESLGRSLHEVGVCLSGVGKYEEARPWYERAVEAKRKGDVHGRVDHASLGQSLHQVGYCLSGVGKYEEARPWYERAVEAIQKGDVHGRVDHASLGRSLHQVGRSLSDGGKYEEARPWYERAVEAQQKGDVHGRVDQGDLGRSLHQVGVCLSSVGKYEEARPWYERAVEAQQKGDVHGRVNHGSLGRSLHQVGYCLSRVGKYEEARPWYERAVEAKRKGDVHGRVDRKSLAGSLLVGAECLRRVGKLEQANQWEKEASELDS